jgi:hypothetical protein
MNNSFKEISPSPQAQGKKHRAFVIKECSLCGIDFFAKNKHCLFCESCKETNQSYKYSDWMGGSTALSGLAFDE